jgi:hypothetical protein
MTVAVTTCTNAYDEEAKASRAPNPLAHCDMKVHCDRYAWALGAANTMI